MTPEERQQFNTMQQDIVKVKQDVTEIGKKVDKLLMYVVGDENSHEVSMLARIRDLEKEKEEMQKEMQSIKDARTKESVQVKIMWAIFGAVGMSLLGVLIYWIKGK